MSNVTTIEGEDYSNPEMDALRYKENIVAHLKWLLDRAEADQISGVISVVSYSDGTFQDIAIGGTRSRGSLATLEMAGTRLANDLIAEL